MINRKPKGMIVINCKNCNEEFNRAGAPNQKYCSIHCSSSIRKKPKELEYTNIMYLIMFHTLEEVGEMYNVSKSKVSKFINNYKKIKPSFDNSNLKIRDDLKGYTILSKNEDDYGNKTKEYNYIDVMKEDNRITKTKLIAKFNA